ncbi:MAG TPA: hypothetical protein DDZ19_06785, partial [Flavobacteriales bacterium]|nr:hypothetical protein [Flavobacteriales bacterium]
QSTSAWILSLFLGSIAWQANAQNEIDILRYSYQESLGTARSMSMGGAFGALGADLACLSGNPAGIGMYRRGDAGISTGLASQKTKVNIAGQFGNANQLSGSTTNLGIALSYPSVNPDWPVTTLAVTNTRRANYNERVRIDDAPLDGTLLDVFLGEAMGANPDELYNLSPFTSSLAWETYLLNPHPNNNPTDYISEIPSGGAYATKIIERSGHLNETNIGLGSGFQERLYIGASIGIVSVEFDEKAIHNERPRIDSLELAEWEYQELLTVEGSGVNFKVGINLALTNWLRAGVAYHTRSRIGFTDEYSTKIRSDFKDGESFDSSSPFNRLEYVVLTPSRLIASGAFILGKMGIITADYERVDYGSGMLKPQALSGPDPYNFETENEAASQLYNLSHAARVGCEFRIQRNWRLRAGAGMETSPFSPAAEIDTDASRYTGSMGFGYRTNAWYASATYRRSWHDRDIYLYSPDLIEAGRLRKTHGMVVASLGFRM